MKILILLPLLFVAPAIASADTALLLDENTALFTIEFTIEDEDFANEVPIVAQHGVEYNDRVDTVGYNVASEEAIEDSIELISGIVLSSAPVGANNRYEVPVSTPTTFTLLILADFGTPLPETAYQARITKLPYWLDGRRTTVHQNQLSDLAMPILEIE